MSILRRAVILSVAKKLGSIFSYGTEQQSEMFRSAQYDRKGATGHEDE